MCQQSGALVNGQEYQISLRLPRDLKEQLEQRATHNWRSLNGEILVMLEDYQKILEQKNL
ncbi:MAG: Arc family DNA-binding protein [Cardiobacterium sp.]|nr:MAG: Arc family DNA-binding protein [Cardiobacterium sp.]